MNISEIQGRLFKRRATMLAIILKNIQNLRRVERLN
jgi:hypothetical protein